MRNNYICWQNKANLAQDRKYARLMAFVRRYGEYDNEVDEIELLPAAIHHM